jgi:hypothetical protein
LSARAARGPPIPGPGRVAADTAHDRSGPMKTTIVVFALCLAVTGTATAQARRRVPAPAPAPPAAAQPTAAQPAPVQAAPAQSASADTSVLPPQEIGTIAVGQTRNGLLEVGDWTMNDATWADVWYINATAGQRLVIDLHSSRFDAYLQLLDPWGTLLAQDDDGAHSGSDARINVTMTEAGRYQIVVNNFGDTPQGGAYTLAVRLAPVR